MHLDDLLEKLNPYGRYQMIAWTCLAIMNCFPPAWHSFSIAFTGYIPHSFGCFNMTEAEATYNMNSSAIAELKTRTGPRKESLNCYRPVEVTYTELLGGESSGIPRFTSSHRDKEIESTVIVEECPVGSIVYSTNDPVQKSMVSDFDLVCSRDFYFVFVSAMEGVGEIFGCVIFGWLSDKIGRRQTYLAASASLLLAGVIASTSVNVIMIALARLGTGAGLIGMNNVGFVFASEIFPPKQRTIFATLHELSWGLAVVSLAGIGYYIRTWRNLCLALTLPVIVVLPLWLFVKESLHWLLCGDVKAKKRSKEHRQYRIRLDKARRIVHWIAAFNNIEFPDATWSSFVRSHSQTVRKFSLLPPPLVRTSSTALRGADVAINAPKPAAEPSEKKKLLLLRLISTPRIRYITFSVTLLWFANSLAYYGLQWSAQLLQADFFMSYFLLAFVELPSTIVVLLIMPKIGRRWTIFGFHIFAAVCCFLVPLIPEQYSTTIVVIAVGGKFAVCSSFTILYVFAVELFPTEIRGFGFAFCSLLGRIGLIAAPFVNWLGVDGGDTGAVLRMLLYGSAMLLTAFLNIGLPETNNRPLADTIEQTERYEEYCEEVRTRSRDNDDVVVRLNVPSIA